MAMGPMIGMRLSRSLLALQWVREDLDLLPEEPTLPPMSVHGTRHAEASATQDWRRAWRSALDSEIAGEQRLEQTSRRVQADRGDAHTSAAEVAEQLRATVPHRFCPPDFGQAFADSRSFLGYSRQELRDLCDSRADDVEQVKAVVRQRISVMLRMASRLPVDRRLSRVHLWVFPGRSPWTRPVEPGHALVSVATITNDPQLEQALRLTMGPEPDLRSRLAARLRRLRNEPIPVVPEHI